MRRSVVVLCALLGAVAAVSAQQLGPTQDSFCQRYATALFGNANGTTEINLITAVVNRAVLGAASSPVVTGIVNVPSQVKYFNGTGGSISGINYYTNTAAFNSLAGKLVNFFATAMGCRDANLTAVANMATIHVPMNIPGNVWTDFINQLVYTLQSFGITATGANGDLTYAGALLQQFGLGAPQQICIQSSCPVWTDFAEFSSGQAADGSPRWYTASLTSAVTIQAGGNVHWNIAPTHGVQQTASDFATNVTGGAIPPTGPGVTRGLTVTFPTAGTYYFVGQGQTATMRGTITVTAVSSSAAPSTAAASSTGTTPTGSSTAAAGSSSSTGNNASSVAASMTVVIAAIAAAFAAKSIDN